MKKTNEPAKAFPDSDIPGNMGQASSAMAESEARVREPGLAPRARRRKAKDDFEVTIAPGSNSTTDVDVTPRH